jgi:hypothetical protein
MFADLCLHLLHAVVSLSLAYTHAYIGIVLSTTITSYDTVVSCVFPKIRGDVYATVVVCRTLLPTWSTNYRLLYTFDNVIINRCSWTV